MAAEDMATTNSLTYSQSIFRGDLICVRMFFEQVEFPILLYFFRSLQQPTYEHNRSTLFFIIINLCKHSKVSLEAFGYWNASYVVDCLTVE